MRREVAVFRNDEPQETMERLAFHLMEMGVSVRIFQVLDDYIIYELVHAEPLPPEEEENV
jgi:hypothetical protein